MLTSLNWQKMTIICTVEELSSCPYKIHKLGRMYATAAPDVHKLSYLVNVCEMAEPWLICFFACNREMQPFSFFFLLAIRCGGGGDFGSGSGSKFNCATRVGSDDLGYGPSSGFSFEPVQTSSMYACMYTVSHRTEYTPSHFCKYFIISFHVTTLKKLHFATMWSSKCTACITV